MLRNDRQRATSGGRGPIFAFLGGVSRAGAAQAAGSASLILQDPKTLSVSHKAGLSKYLYLHDHATPRALQAGLTGYFPFYNEERIHASLDYRTPMAVYLEAV